MKTIALVIYLDSKTYEYFGRNLSFWDTYDQCVEFRDAALKIAEEYGNVKVLAECIAGV